MPMRHLDLLTLERFVASRLDRDRMIEAGRHLFACATCRTRLNGEVLGGAEILRRLRSKWPGGNDTAQYEKILERAQVRAAERICLARREQAHAEALADELEAEPPALREKRIATDGRFRNAVLVDRLLERARASWGEDTDRAEQLAQLALGVIDQLDPTLYGSGLICDLKARSWAYSGNALRIRSDLAGAEVALAKAERLLDDGSCEPLELALVLELKTSLLRAQRRLGQALETIRQVAAIYRRIRDTHMEGRALVGEAIVLGYAGELEKSIATYFRAVERIDPARDPHLAFAARHNLLADLVESGRTEEALPLLPEVRRGAAEVGNCRDKLRFTWLEALIEIETGQHLEAEEKLERVRAEYVEQGDGFLVALVSLDLARLYLEEGRTAETRRLASEMQSIFMAKNIRREALASLVIFQRAAEQEAATVVLVKDIARRIKHVQRNSPSAPERPA